MLLDFSNTSYNWLYVIFLVCCILLANCMCFCFVSLLLCYSLLIAVNCVMDVNIFNRRDVIMSFDLLVSTSLIVACLIDKCMVVVMMVWWHFEKRKEKKWINQRRIGMKRYRGCWWLMIIWIIGWFDYYVCSTVLRYRNDRSRHCSLFRLYLKVC